MNQVKYTHKPNRALYLSKVPIGTKFHTVSDRCFARYEPMGDSKGLWIYNHQELEITSQMKLPTGYWYQVRLTENTLDSPCYWVYDHCITPSKFDFWKAKILNYFNCSVVESNY